MPLKGSKDAMQAVAAGEVPAMSLLVADIGTLVKSGKARLLAVASDQRIAAFADVPTFRESGYDLVALSWFALFAPAGTPAAILKADYEKWGPAVRASGFKPD